MTRPPCIHPIHRPVQMGPGLLAPSLTWASIGLPVSGLDLTLPLDSITGFTPAHYWIMGTDSTDHGFEERDLDVLNNVDIVSSTPFPEATYFDNTTDNRRTTYNLTDVATSYTVGCFFRIVSFTDTFQVLSSHGGNADSFSTREFNFALNRNAGADGYQPYFTYFAGGTAVSVTDASGDYDITDTNWHHMAAHRSASKHRLWLDGQLIATSDAAAATVNNTLDFYLTGQIRSGGGSEGLEMSHYFHEKSELSDAQIAAVVASVPISFPTWP